MEKSKRKVTIECTEKELTLISKALDFYARIGIGQLKEIADHPTFQKINTKLSTKDGEVDYGIYHAKNDVFETQLARARDMYFGTDLGKNGSYGIFSKDVDDISRIACDIHQTIKYSLKHTQYPADICKLARMTEPEFKITIDDSGN